MVSKPRQTNSNITMTTTKNCRTAKTYHPQPCSPRHLSYPTLATASVVHGPFRIGLHSAPCNHETCQLPQPRSEVLFRSSDLPQVWLRLVFDRKALCADSQKLAEGSRQHISRKCRFYLTERWRLESRRRVEEGTGYERRGCKQSRNQALELMRLPCLTRGQSKIHVRGEGSSSGNDSGIVTDGPSFDVVGRR